jgi:hypothetical protein
LGVNITAEFSYKNLEQTVLLILGRFTYQTHFLFSFSKICLHFNLQIRRFETLKVNHCDGEKVFDSEERWISGNNENNFWYFHCFF